MLWCPGEDTDFTTATHAAQARRIDTHPGRLQGLQDCGILGDGVGNAMEIAGWAAAAGAVIVIVVAPWKKLGGGPKLPNTH